MFGDWDFSKMNETDVRENILRPLLTELGYRQGTECDVMSEVSLRYPKAYVGRKKPTKDPNLRGAADYILEVDRRLRWVLEAKPPTSEVWQDDVEQAYTYAAHPEVRAIYFSISNGLEFHIHSTAHGPSAGPILSSTYDRLESHYQQIAGLLHPDSLRRDYPSFALDTGAPLGSGLRSFAKITKGKVTYLKNTLGLSQLTGMNIYITDGSLQRGDEDNLIAYLKNEGMYAQHHEFAKYLGLETAELTSQSADLSINPAEPTVFRGVKTFAIPPNTPIPNPMGRLVSLPSQIQGEYQIEASGHLSERIFGGDIWVHLVMTGMPKSPLSPNGCISLRQQGQFSVHLV